MNSETEPELKEILPKKPRKISEDLPENIETFSETAKLSQDGRKQYLVRFPKKVAEALGLENVKDVEFIVTMPLPDAKPENAELAVRLIRK